MTLAATLPDEIRGPQAQFLDAGMTKCATHSTECSYGSHVGCRLLLCVELKAAGKQQVWPAVGQALTQAAGLWERLTLKGQSQSRGAEV